MPPIEHSLEWAQLAVDAERTLAGLHPCLRKGRSLRGGKPVERRTNNEQARGGRRCPALFLRAEIVCILQPARTLWP